VSTSRNTHVSRWLRLFAVGAMASPVSIMAVALAGRHSHKVGALVVMGAIYAASQTYGALCLWRAYQATHAPSR
jgi:hypothetical protein